MPKRTRNYDSWLFEQLTNPQVAATYINAAIEDSPEMLQTALRNVAEARRMSKVAEEAGVNRESLYRALSKEGNPTLSTLNAVLHAVGLRMAVVEERQSESATPVTPTAAPNQATPYTTSTAFDLTSTDWTTGSVTISGAKTSYNAIDVSAPQEVPFYLLDSEETTGTITRI
jgi:probable addiction module antidote protein